MHIETEIGEMQLQAKRPPEAKEGKKDPQRASRGSVALTAAPSWGISGPHDSGGISVA